MRETADLIYLGPNPNLSSIKIFIEMFVLETNEGL